VKLNRLMELQMQGVMGEALRRRTILEE